MGSCFFSFFLSLSALGANEHFQAQPGRFRLMQQHLSAKSRNVSFQAEDRPTSDYSSHVSGLILEDPHHSTPEDPHVKHENALGLERRIHSAWRVFGSPPLIRTGDGDHPLPKPPGEHCSRVMVEKARALEGR